MTKKDAPCATSAICGLFCDSCTLYIGTTEDPRRLEKLAANRGTTAENIRCEGCRSNVLGTYCRTCQMKACAARKGVGFCSECDEYPCGILIAFQKQMPHRIELFESLEDIRDHGEAQWRARMEKNYRCESCGTLNAIYDEACRQCGHTPPNPYAGRHKADIERYKNR